MARPKKFDYDSDDFIIEIIGIAMQGLTDAEIADSLADKFGVSLSPEAFSSMKTVVMRIGQRRKTKGAPLVLIRS